MRSLTRGTLKRLLPIVAIASIVVAFLLCLPQAHAAESTGYWKYRESEVVGPSSNFDGASMTGGYGSYHCHATQTDSRMEGYHGSDTKTSCVGETIDITITIQEPPKTTLKPGDVVACEVTTADFSTSQYYDSMMFYTCGISMNMGKNEYHNSEIDFENEDGIDRLGIDRTWEADDYYGYGGHFFVIGGDQVLRATVPGGYKGATLWIRSTFSHGRGEDSIETYYYYDWVENETPAGVTGNDNEGNGSTTNGNGPSTDEDELENMNNLEDEEDTGKEDVVIDTEASGKKGEVGGWVIPAAIIGAAAVGGVVLARRRKKNGGKNDTDPDDGNNNPPSYYTMVLNKNFGNELGVNRPPKDVGARIIEHAPDGRGGYVQKRRDDLSQRITARAGQNMEVAYARFQAPYLVAGVKAVRNAGAAVLLDASGYDPNKAVVTFTFVGDGANFVNNVSFKIIGDPEIVFINPDTGRAYAKGSTEMELLIGDAEGMPLHFAVTNLTSQLDAEDIGFTTADGSVFADCEPYADQRFPNASLFKALVKNSLTVSSPYGTWPLERTLSIVAASKEGDRAEATVAVHLWPQGIFFDTRQVIPNRVREDGVLVDTSDFLLSAGAEYNIEGATMEVGVAYKNDRGVLVVDRPDEPGDGAYLRLEPADAASKKPLAPDASRIWYLLTYSHKPAYGTDQRLGTLELKPLLPLVSSNASAEYRGSITLTYNNGERFSETATVFGLRGLDANMVDADREVEIQRIMQLLKLYQLEDWSRVDAVLRTYGLEAEKDLARLGSDAEQRRAAQSGAELIRNISQIQSVQRLRAVRKAVFEAADITVEKERLEAKSTADLFDKLYIVASTVRWADDIAFTCWWYMLLGTKGAYVDSLMSPLKDWVLGYVEKLGLRATEKLGLMDGTTDISPEKYFTWDSYYNKVLFPSMENELLMLVVNALSTGGVSLVENPKTYVAIGGVGCFFFYKNFPKHQKKDPETGRIEFDLWGALKSTLADLTVFGVKAVISIFLARKFASKMSPTPEQGLLSADGVDREVDRFLVKAFNWFTSPALEAGEAASNFVTRIAAPLGKEIVGSPVIDQNIVVPLGSNAQLEIWQAFYDAFQQKVVDVAPGVVEERFPGVTAASSSFEAWVRSLGTMTVGVPKPDGTTIEVKVPYLTAMSLFVDWIFEKCGLDFLEIDYGGVLPEDPGYYSHDELVEKIEAIKGARAEITFLTKPSKGVVGNTSPFVDGAEPPTFGTGIDWHRYAK